MSTQKADREDCSLASLFPRLLKYKDQLNAENSDAPNKITVMGHRGGFKPDNSMHSFQLALDSNCVPIVELDVRTLLFEHSIRFG